MTVFFAPMGSVRVKAACRIFIKLSHGSLKILSFNCVNSGIRKLKSLMFGKIDENNLNYHIFAV